jgi:hypothetical protein
MNYRKAAGDKAASAGLQITTIKQHGKKQDCLDYLNNGNWPAAWGEPKPATKKGSVTKPVTAEPMTKTIEAVKEPLPVIIVEPEPVKEPLPVASFAGEAVKKPLPVPAMVKPPKANKGMIANGRNQKGVPSFDKWFCQIFPKDVTYPAWRYLTKTATDVANICRAKSNRAAHCNQKDSQGVPIFDFTFSEAVNFFKWSRPTFTKAIHLLLEIGFIEYSRPGGIVNGNGVKALYRLSNKWQSWEPPETDTTNISKARSAKNRIQVKVP